MTSAVSSTPPVQAPAPAQHSQKQPKAAAPEPAAPAPKSAAGSHVDIKA